MKLRWPCMSWSCAVERNLFCYLLEEAFNGGGDASQKERRQKWAWNEVRVSIEKQGVNCMSECIILPRWVMVGGECTSTRVQIWLNGTAWSPCALYIYIYLGGGFNFNFKLALSDYGPWNLEGWRYWERNGSRVEREQRDNTNYKKPWFFFTSEKGNLEFGTKIECSFLVIWVWIKFNLAVDVRDLGVDVRKPFCTDSIGS